MKVCINSNDSEKKVAIVDYGCGNIGSVANMISWLGYTVEVTSDAANISKCSHCILPGVGSFDQGMSSLHKSNLIPVLNEFSSEAKPIMGICLGMQLLTSGSEEGFEAGLGWIPGTCKKFKSISHGMKVPHMGWNYVEFDQESEITAGLDNPKFYFVHSYYVECDEKYVFSETNYGHTFASGIRSNNIYGFQFHPEKSHKYGLQLLQNFMRLTA